MDEQEKEDLLILKKQIQENKIVFYSYLSMLDTANETVLLHSGYKGKTNAEAMQLAFRLHDKQIKALLNNHIAKYPDK